MILGLLYIIRNKEKIELTADERLKAPGKFIKLKAGYTHYELAGPDTGKVIVLLHGFSTPYFVWDGTFQHLAKHGYRVLRYDMYGRGFSDRPDSIYHRDLYFSQLTELLSLLHLKTPVDIAGVAFGGMLAANFTAQHPELVNKVILIDPAFDSPPPEEPELMARYYEVTHPTERSESQMHDFKYPTLHTDWVSRYRVQMQYKGFRHALVSTLYNYPFNGRDIYAQLNTRHKPVLLIWGRDDKTVPYNYADSVKNVLNASFFPVDDAGHLPYLEQADIVNERILEFLREK
ncbi:alpha/beta fold hydrolase [Mucilaginibacter myungsuensis]|uniref:alpha/beta fold hydrolase n=1 Tax=Mucilaginibacter myungsuensis TaxID=649104 RepID=UPI0025B3A994|nr:alpha/beta hydrolase [Mucilaginibacter myungsuensis]